MDKERALRLERLHGDLDGLESFAHELSQLGNRRGIAQPDVPSESGGPPQAKGLVFPNRISANQENVEQGLAKLVLTLIDIIRRLMEKQAVRRIEGRTLTDEEIERLGETFLKLDQKMTELKAVFGLRDEDLDLDLGPLRALL
jgi:hypothetical protein